MAEELLVIQEPKEGEFLKEIKWNKDEIVSHVTDIANQYEGMTYTDEEIKYAKEDRAHLNALKKSISDRRIQVKKAYMEPYDRFDAEVREVVALIDSPIGLIDRQIKEYEESAKKQKENELRDYYKSEVGDLEESVPFEKIFDPTWMNARTSLKKAKSEIKDRLDKIRSDIQNIEVFFKDSSYENVAIDNYLNTLDISESIAKAQKIKEMDEKKETQRRIAEEERLRRMQEEEEERKRQIETEEGSGKIISFRQPASIEEAEVQQAPEAEKENATIPALDATKKPEPAASDKEKLCKASFTIYGTKEQIFAVRDFMRANGIKFGKVEE